MSTRGEQKALDALPCLACVRRPSTCDGKKPQCERCKREGTKCLYGDDNQGRKQTSGNPGPAQSSESSGTNDSSSSARENSDSSSAARSDIARRSILHRLIAAIRACDEEEVRTLIDSIRNSHTLDGVRSGIDMALETADETRVAQVLESLQDASPETDPNHSPGRVL